jgi:adenylate cyclase
MAFWGAPRPLENHGLHACLAAIQCRDYTAKLSEELTGKGQAPLFTRIGLNTGYAIIGNIGYDARLNYTAMGDMVNLASRLEQLNKYYGTQILISDSTYQAAKSAIAARFIDTVAVKGKTIPVRIYEVICRKGEMTEAQAALVSGYALAMELYLARNFQAAVAQLQKLVQTYPADRAIAIMLERNLAYQTTPPPDNWQGEHIMRDK